MMRKAAIALCFWVAYISPASAQFVSGSPTGDVLIKANKSTYKGGVTILEGDVDVKQGDVQIYADHMTIYRDRSKVTLSQGIGSGRITKIDAKGKFRYITPENSVSGDRGVYEREKGIITVTGNVRAKQPGGNTARTSRLIYNVNTRKIRMTGQQRTTVTLGGQ